MSRSWRKVSKHADGKDLPGRLAHAWFVSQGDKRLDPDDLGSAIFQSWILSREPEQVLEVDEWIQLFEDAGVYPGSHLFMGGQGIIYPRERLVPEGTLYRGALPDRRLGLSWTPSRDKAQSYSSRYGAKPYVYRMRVPSRYVLMHFMSGPYGHDTVVLHPDVFDLHEPESVKIDDYW